MRKRRGLHFEYMDTPTPSPAPDQTPPSPPPVAPVVPLTPEEDIAKNKDLAALSYLWILSLVVYWTRRDSPFAQFHARQGVTLFILSILFMLVPVVNKALALLVLIGCAFGFINAAQGKRTDLPLVAAISRFDWKQLRTDWQSIVTWAGRFWHSIMSQMPKHHETAQATAKPSPAPTTPASPTAATASPAAPAVTPTPEPTAPTPPVPPASPSTPA